MTTSSEGSGKPTRDWEGMGGASGLLATLMFVLAFVMFLRTDPTGGTSFPSIEYAQKANGFFSQHVTAMRFVVLFTVLGIMLFLWFLGSLWRILRAAEGELARGATIALVGASVSSVLMLVGLSLISAVGLSTSPAQAEAAPALFAAGALLFTLGGGVLSLFFFAVGRVILHAGAMGRWLGWLALLAGTLAVLAFLTPFWETGLFNASTGALGVWAWWAAFVVWVLCASVVLTIEEHRRARVAHRPVEPPPEVPADEMPAPVSGDVS